MISEKKLESAGPLWILDENYDESGGGDLLMNGTNMMNLKMIGLDYKFECGQTAKEVLTIITKKICNGCLVNPMCNVVCPWFMFTYREVVRWLNENEHRKVTGLEVLEVLMEIVGSKTIDGVEQLADIAID